jgi:hypothetical protein
MKQQQQQQQQQSNCCEWIRARTRREVVQEHNTDWFPANQKYETQQQELLCYTV